MEDSDDRRAAPGRSGLRRRHPYADGHAADGRPMGRAPATRGRGRAGERRPAGAGTGRPRPYPSRGTDQPGLRRPGPQDGSIAVTAPTEQEVIPYDVLLPQMETELHRRDSQIVMLNARLEMRDRTIAQLRSQIAQFHDHSAGHAPHGPEQQPEDEQVQLPPPADQQPVPEVGTQRSAVASP